MTGRCVSEPGHKPRIGDDELDWQPDERRYGPRPWARRLLVQALYQWRVTDAEYADVSAQFSASPDMTRADHDYFLEALQAITSSPQALIAAIDAQLDRPWVQLDPVEQSVLLLGAYELQQRLDIPYRAVINEAVELSHTFGAEGGHKYVNGVLDKIAAEARAIEVQAAKG